MNYLNNRQIAFFLFSTIVGYGVMILPKTAAESADTAAWLILLIATMIFLLPTYIITRLGFIYEHKTFYDYSCLLTVKFLTSLFMTIYICFFFFSSAFAIRAYAETINLTFLLKTPTWAISLLLLIVVYYGVTRGINSIARLCELYGVIIILIMLFVRCIILSQGKLINLMPIFGLQDIFTLSKSTAKIPFGTCWNRDIVIPFDKKKNKNILKYTLFSICVIGFLYIFEIQACISVLGIDSIIYFQDALNATLRSIDIHSLAFFQRLDGIAFFSWTLTVFTTILTLSYGTVFLLSSWFKNISFNFLTLLVLVLSFLVSRIPGTVETVLLMLTYSSYLSFLTAGLIPLILFVITKVKKYDKN